MDVFLVLASEASDHTAWMQFIRQAEAYQTRIRSLVPKDQPTQDIGSRIPPPPSERGSPPVNVRRPEPVVSSAAGNPQGLPSQTSVRTSPISKILKPFQGGREIGNPLEEYTFSNLQTPNLRQQAPPQTPMAPPVNSAQLASQKPATAPVEERPPVAHEVYERALSENKVLHERLQAVMKETDEKMAFLESRSRELEDRVAMMVPKMDYDQLRLEFENMVPKHEYDRLKTELANTVPITHYYQLLDRISNMVPREIYMNSERRVLELEDNLRRSVPLAVIDDIANEVSYVSILAEVPPIVNDPSKKGEKEEGAEDQVKGRNH